MTSALGQSSFTAPAASTQQTKPAATMSPDNPLRKQIGSTGMTPPSGESTYDLSKGWGQSINRHFQSLYGSAYNAPNALVDAVAGQMQKTNMSDDQVRAAVQAYGQQPAAPAPAPTYPSSQPTYPTVPANPAPPPAPQPQTPVYSNPYAPAPTPAPPTAAPAPSTPAQPTSGSGYQPYGRWRGWGGGYGGGGGYNPPMSSWSPPANIQPDPYWGGGSQQPPSPYNQSPFAQPQPYAPFSGYYSDASRGNPQPGMSYSQVLTPAYGQSQYQPNIYRGGPYAGIDGGAGAGNLQWNGRFYDQPQSGGNQMQDLMGAQAQPDIYRVPGTPSALPGGASQAPDYQTQLRQQFLSQFDPGAGSATNPNQSLDAYRAALPNPNQIVARNYYQLPQSSRDFLMGTYEALGYDPTDVEDTISRTTPTWRVPYAGSVR